MSKLPNFVLGRYRIVLNVRCLFLGIIWVSFGYHLSITFSISLGILGAILSATLGAISPYK